MELEAKLVLDELEALVRASRLDYNEYFIPPGELFEIEVKRALVDCKKLAHNLRLTSRSRLRKGILKEVEARASALGRKRLTSDTFNFLELAIGAIKLSRIARPDLYVFNGVKNLGDVRALLD